LEISQVSEAAKQKISNAGGTVKTVYYDRLGMRYLLNPKKFAIPPKRAKPILKQQNKFDDWGQQQNSLNKLD
jgi:large subunit ribosomal protein L15